MKKINYLMCLVLILSTKGLLCQDLLDPPKLNVVDTSNSINRSSNFFLGWNWGSEGLKLDSALNINFYHQSVTDSVFRGYAKNVINDFSQPTRFYITGNMIYNSMADSINSPITLSALAQFTGIKDGGILRNNPYLKPDWWYNCYALAEFIDLTECISYIHR